MAQIFAASIYGRNSNPFGGIQGSTIGFPSASVWITPAPSGISFSGVTMNSVIQLIPGGTVVNEPKFYSSATVATLISAANA